MPISSERHFISLISPNPELFSLCNALSKVCFLEAGLKAVFQQMTGLK